MDEHNLFQVPLSNEQNETVVVCFTEMYSALRERCAMIECVHWGLLEENRTDSMKKYL